MQVPKRRFCSHPRHLALVPVGMDVGADVQVVSVLGSWNMAACVVVVMEWRTEKTRSARSKWLIGKAAIKWGFLQNLAYFSRLSKSVNQPSLGR
jgi:hypothetical protein